MLDLRVPSGWFFTLLGLILLGMGVFAPETRAALTDANVNLYSGLAMLVFGVFLLIMAMAAASPAAARHDRGIPAAVRLGGRRARVPRAGPRQPDRRAHRLQSRLRPARGARIWPLTSPRRLPRDGKLRIYSEYPPGDARVERGRSRRAHPARHWTDYPIGVAQELLRAGFAIAPANLLIRSTVPEGSGLSSSAALEVSTALALLAGRPIDPLELARLCQRAERNFVGMPCGIMDQYISVFGREHSAVEIDCRSLGHRFVELPAGVTFVAVNTMVKHALAGSAYKERVAECAAAVAGIQREVSAESRACATSPPNSSNRWRLPCPRWSSAAPVTW